MLLRMLYGFSLILTMGFLSSCSSVYYLYQAGRGQLQLLNRGRPIEDVIRDPTTDERVRTQLQQLSEIKKFGERFGLKPTQNYSEYVKLDRDAVVYVVTVSDELALKPKIFSFPIAGSFNYIGWFAKSDAEEFGAKYQKEGYDVDVRGASAYSTLGWFKDPLLSTMIRSLPDLVNVVLHESVHATLYIKNQSYFNESLASFVADQLTQKYFEEKHEIDAEGWKNYLKDREWNEKIRTRLSQAYRELGQIYSSAKSPEEKRQEKAAYFETLKKDVRISRNINNATLIQFQTYDASDHGFRALLRSYEGDVREFLRALSALKNSDFEKNQEENFDTVVGKFTKSPAH